MTTEDRDSADPADDSRYEAVASRDARFDGVFFFAVATTGIYCRPSCPATTPKRRNVTFYRTAAAAQGAGYRACRRCRPDAVPGSAEWNTRADVVGRAVRLIGDGVVDREGVTGLAARLGYSARQVQRQLTAELGAGPLALARAQRGHTARVLLQTTSLQAAEIAFAAGFASIRQFNDTIRAIYAATPGELRSARPGRTGHAVRIAPAGGRAGIPLRLAHRTPYATAPVFDYLAARAVTGVEEVTGTPGRRIYRRTLRLPGGPGIAEVAERPGPAGGWLECRLQLSCLRDLTAATQRIRRLFDLDADPRAVDEKLGADPLLAPLVAARPGLRAPGAADPHEAALRIAAEPAGPGPSAALVRAYGEPLTEPSGGLTHLFPDPAALAGAALGELPPDRREPVRALAGALAGGSVLLDPGTDRDAAEALLAAIPGIGPDRAARIRMRALGDPDVLPGRDPAAALRSADGEAPRSEVWRPWRSYAFHHLRAAGSDRPRTTGEE
ncbi:DNA-3-methyladenine glycosylase 2 family protein [Streptomyces qinzhouensis]|uniref:DNA-3-methyladenine glycosylase 2 family protein n=1 Tax=Streptomyces qinzhouensis TaxID=2599401 RepID=A0A5B8JIJ5_9ACTN|nr:AlkA N-terminal domain-containing protein [Streptomyces qinzhouensis]QDY80204.1 DNA-3-methyladenine glycosylase 2 family protein [Streptomyces qinzhouensis]